MPQFRKKPTIFEARLLMENTREGIIAWVGSDQECSITEDGGLDIRTPGNALHAYTLHAPLGHWIVHDPMSGFHPMPPDVFEEHYEVVT